MSFLELMLHPGMWPFAVAIAVVLGLFLLGLVLLPLGISVLGGGGDVDMSVELDAADGVDGAAEGSNCSLADMDTCASDPVSLNLATALSWLGLGKVPFTVWLVGTLTGFGLAGYGLQLTAAGLLGSPIPALAACVIALPIGLGLGARLAGLVARILPQQESTAISRRSFGNRFGVITVGTARPGQPAEARFKDGHGNMHYAMVEPLREEELPQGTEIAILRMADGKLKAIRASAADDASPATNRSSDC